MPRGYAWSKRTAATAAIVLMVAGNALVRGGVQLPVIALSAVLAAAALALAAGRSEEPRTVPVLALGLALVVGFIGLQVVPLPPGIVEVLSPRATAMLDEVSALLGAGPGPRALSLEPGETAIELAKAAMLACVVAATSLLAGSDRRRDQLLRGLALSGVAIAAVYFGAALLGRTPLLEPRVTFVNPNHLAGFLQLACWPALGFALRAHGRARVAWILGFAFSASGIFLSLSRAGIAAFFVAAGLFAILWMRTERKRVRVRRQRSASAGDLASGSAPAPRSEEPAPELPILESRFGRSGALVMASAIAASLAISAWLALGPIVKEVESVADANKVELKLSLWPLTAQVIRDFPLTGIGRGAYGTLHTAYLPDAIGGTFTHTENEWLQLPADLGLVAGLGVILLFAWAYLAAARRRDLSRPFAGALAGAGALVLHNAFDFSLEIPGVAIPFGIVLGIAARDMPGLRAGRWVVRLAAAGGLAVAAAGVALHLPHRTQHDVDAILAAARSEDAIALARQVFPRHPADWTIPASIGGKLVAEGRCRDAVPWITGAMQRNPTAAQPHHAMAWCLARHGQDALAKREYRLAFSYGDMSAMTEASAIFKEPGALLEVAPKTPRGLMAAGWALAERPEEAAEAFRRAWESFQVPEALHGLASAQYRLMKYADALGTARLLQSTAPRTAGGYVFAARALDALGQPDEAAKELELGAARLPGSADVLVPLGTRLVAQRRYSQARTVFNRILARDGPLLASKHMHLARTYEGQGRYREAFEEAQTARDIAPHHVGTLIVLSRYAEALGQFDDALQALETAATLPDSPADVGERLSRLRAVRSSRDAKRAAGVP